jgi:AraC family transcriptional regulator, arabinose operon regulatory protein
VAHHAVNLASLPTYWRCEPTWWWDAKPLHDPLLWWVLGGTGEVTLDGDRVELASGIGIVFAKGSTPSARHDPRRPLLVFGTHFRGDHRGFHVRARDPELLSGLARRADAGYRRGDRLGREQSDRCVTQMIALLWEDHALPPQGRVDAALDELIRAVRTNPARRWTVDEMARRCSLSRAQLTRRFVAVTGLPPHRYVVLARVGRAEQLLREGTLTVTQVATALGYTDMAFFSRQFKAVTGRPPSVVRLQ